MKDVGKCVSGKCPGDGRDPERTDTPEHRAVESFIRAHKAHRAYLERKLNGTGVYRSQHQILMCIARNPDISQKSLAEIYHVSTAAVTVTLKKLEKGGFITRTVNKNDNRCNEIGLTEKGRAVVDNSMQSSVPHIYVIGDAADGYPQLAHAASAQGLAVAAAIAEKPFMTDLKLVPGCVYTQPEIASVGLTEAEAKEQGIAVHVGKYPTSANGKSLLTGQERGFIKLVADENDVLIGAQLMCARATDMVGELALAIAQKMTAAQAAALIRPHPTFEESIGEAAGICAGKMKAR